jgi:hypothetical protein
LEVEVVPKATAGASQALEIVASNGYRVMEIARFEAEDLFRLLDAPMRDVLARPSLLEGYEGSGSRSIQDRDEKVFTTKLMRGEERVGGWK